MSFIRGKTGRKRRWFAHLLLFLAALTAAACLWSGWHRLELLQVLRINVAEAKGEQVTRPYPYHPWFASDYVTLPRMSIESGSFKFCLIWVRGAPVDRVTLQTRNQTWYVHKQELDLSGMSAFEWKVQTWSGLFGLERLDAAFPVWVPSAVFAVPGGCLLMSGLHARRRARAGSCTTCGYNLKGLAPNSHCPECGKSSPHPS